MNDDLPAPQPAKQKEKVSRPPAGPSRLRRARQSLFRPRQLLLLAMAVAAVMFGPRLLRKLPDLNEQEAYRVTSQQIRLTKPPHWIPHDLVEQVAAAEGWSQSPPSLLDDRLVTDIAKAFCGHPWIEKVKRVEKTSDRVVRVQVEYRVPVALVDMGEARFYPVDAKGTLLPPADFSQADLARYPIIKNAQSLPQGGAGTQWGDETIAGAAAIAEHFLRPAARAADAKASSPKTSTSRWNALNLDAIWIPKRTRATVEMEQVNYQILTRDGSRVLWGRAPGTGHPGELSAEQKISRLSQYLDEFKSYRWGKDPLEIDIRHWSDITDRRLTERPPGPRG